MTGSLKKQFGLLGYVLMVTIGVVAALFVDTVSWLPGYAGQRFVLAAFLILLPVLSLLFLANFPAFKACSSRLPGMGLMISLLSGLVSLLLAEGQNEFAWLELVFYGLYLLAVVCLVALMVASGQKLTLVRISLLIMASGCLFYALSTPTIYYYALSDGVHRLDNFLPWGFVNIRYWSHTASWLLPLLPCVVLMRPFKRHRLWAVAIGFTAGIWWWMLVMSSSRGSMVGLAVAALVVCTVFGRLAWPWLKIYLVHIILGLMTWLLLSVLIPGQVVEDAQMRSLGTDSSGRLPLWYEAWQMSLQSFPFGMGPQSWITHEVLTDAYSQSRSFGHPHNMYLMWAAEYGWLAMLGLGLVGWAAVRRLWQWCQLAGHSHIHSLETMLLVGLTGSVVAGLVHASVSAVFISPASMLLGLFILSAFWSMVMLGAAHYEKASGAEKHGVLPGLHRIVLASVVLLALLFWLHEVRSYYHAMQADEAYYQTHVFGGHQPRFWFHGYFPRHPSEMPGNSSE